MQKAEEEKMSHQAITDAALKRIAELENNWHTRTLIMQLQKQLDPFATQKCLPKFPLE
jgi:hypothetical protein